MKTTVLALALAALLSSSAANAADYGGWWWSAATDGMGLNVEQQGDRMAVAWYHFDADRSPSYVLFAGTPVDGVLSADLQTTSGPPPGPDYNPAEVTHATVGTATLRFTSQTNAILEYTLNGQSGSFSLGRFTAQEIALDTPNKWKYTAGYSGSCGERTSSGYAQLTKTGTGSYRLETEDGNGGELCTYDLNLAQAGRIFAGNGRFSCNNGREGSIVVSRLQRGSDNLTLEHSRTETSTQGCNESGTLVAIMPGWLLFSRNDHQGWWWDPAQDGMGFNIEQQGDMLAIAWYHFDEDHSPSYALLAGMIEQNHRLSGPLQKAEGPPPGAGYNPADVSRTTAGTATITFGYDENTAYKDTAVFEYTINGRSGSLNLTRFPMQAAPKTGTWQVVSTAALPGCPTYMRTPPLSGINPPYPQSTTGTATMEETGDRRYRLTFQGGEDFKAQGGLSFICTYDITLANVQDGPVFFGDIGVSCTYGDDSSPSPVRGMRPPQLIVENDSIVFGRHLVGGGFVGACPEKLIGFPRHATATANP